MDKLVVDFFSGDRGAVPATLTKLKQLGWPWCGAYLKASQGVLYPGPARLGGGAWFKQMWAATSSEKRMDAWWRKGVYHYAEINQDPHLQVRFLHSLVCEAGGMTPGIDLPVMLDLENSARDGNEDKPGAKKLQDFVTAFAGECVAIGLGKPVLYGNVYLRENGYRGLRGCAGIVVASYTETLGEHVGGAANLLGELGLGVPALAGWQYTGTDDRHGVPTPFSDKAAKVRYPTELPFLPGVGVDITAWQWPL